MAALIKPSHFKRFGYRLLEEKASLASLSKRETYWKTDLRKAARPHFGMGENQRSSEAAGFAEFHENKSRDDTAEKWPMGAPAV